MSTSPPSVSVVIPCYNHAHFLPEAIESVLAQAYPHREIIVVDDGATDHTADVAARYPVRCLRQTNQGLAAARNAGLRASRGTYVVFLDADDRLLPGALEVGVATLAAHPGAAFAVGLHRRIAADGTPLPVHHRARVEHDHYASLVRRCWIAMPAAVMHRRAVLDALGGFDTTVRYAEDYELYLRITRQLPIVDHYTEVAEYRQYPGSMSRNAERMLAATLEVLRRHRPDATATAAHRAAYRARENAVWYYNRLIDGALLDLKARRWRSAGRSLLTFARYLPHHPAYAARVLATPLRLVGRQKYRAGADRRGESSRRDTEAR